jgi:hypothetical protein
MGDIVIDDILIDEHPLFPHNPMQPLCNHCVVRVVSLQAAGKRRVAQQGEGEGVGGVCTRVRVSLLTRAAE